MEDRFPEQAESGFTYLGDQKNGDRIIKQLLNSVIAKYRDLSVLATDKSWYFAQPRSIIVNHWFNNPPLSEISSGATQDGGKSKSDAFSSI